MKSPSLQASISVKYNENIQTPVTKYIWEMFTRVKLW